eukprot:12607974-Alexandrium_andersonii.AAC.1
MGHSVRADGPEQGLGDALGPRAQSASGLHHAPDGREQPLLSTRPRGGVGRSARPQAGDGAPGPLTGLN